MSATSGFELALSERDITQGWLRLNRWTRRSRGHRTHQADFLCHTRCLLENMRRVGAIPGLTPVRPQDARRLTNLRQIINPQLANELVTAAFQSAMRGLIIMPNDPFFLSAAGRALLQLGALEPAKLFFDQALWSRPVYEPAMRGLADIALIEASGLRTSGPFDRPPA